MKKLSYKLLFLIVLFLFSIKSYSQGLSIMSGREYATQVVNSVSSNLAKCYVDKNGRYRIDSKTDSYIIAPFIEYKIDESNDYSIDIQIEQVDANDEKNFGLIFGFKDWDNYSYFLIDGSEHYTFGRIVNGLRFPISTKYCKKLVFGDYSNKLKIWKHNDKFLLIINREIIETIDAFPLSGNGIAFSVHGRGEFAIHSLIVKEFIDDSGLNLEDTSNNNISNNNNISKEKQKGESPEIVGSGTGFLIDKNGYLVTCTHVIDDASAFFVCLQRRGEWKSYEAKVIKNDPTNDLSIIKIDDKDFVPYDVLPYAISTETEDIAADIFTLGYPRVQVMGVDVKYTTGVINARSGVQGDPTHYQISASIDFGSSGGPLFNSNGYIIGITDGCLDKATFGDINYAIKSAYLKTLTESLPHELDLPNDKSVSKMKRTDQIKTIAPYVALILVVK